MKCNEIDFILYAEGDASAGMKNHVSGCPVCQVDLDRFMLFTDKILPVYREGKLRDEKIDRQLAAMDSSSMKPLPAGIAVKVKGLKENRLAERLKKIIRGNRESAEAWIEDVLHPRMDALPASPKDITKTKKTKPKTRTKKTLPKKGSKI